MKTRERLAAIGRHLPLFEAKGFRFGRWIPSTTDAEGVIHLGWYEPSAEAEAFLADDRRAASGLLSGRA